MAKKSAIARDAHRRAALRAAIKSPCTSDAERVLALRALQRLPRDASPTRLRHRDAIDGRPRGTYRRFGISRVRLREMAHRGQLPGVTKSSW